MNLDDLIIVSVDDHVIEPPHVFEHHLAASMRPLAPKMETDSAGNDYWIYEGRKITNPANNAVAGRPREEYGVEPTSLSHLRPGTYDVRARVDDMNANGILGSMCFGSFIAFDGSFFLTAKDKKITLSMLKAYNDWHIDEWCGSYPGRFIPLGYLPLWDMEETCTELRRIVDKGCRAISMTENPSKRGLPSIHSDYWEPLWTACAEAGVVICLHIGTGNTAPHPSMDSPIEAWITLMPISIAVSAADWLNLKALQRHPSLRIALSEGGIGWIPYFLERADFTHEHHHFWTNQSFGTKRPSEVFREHFLTCFIDDRFGVRNRHEIGVQSIMYECDYPHSDTVWPRSPEKLFESLAGVPEAEIDLMLHGNAMREFRYDPFSVLGRDHCTVGALRKKAANVDIAPRSYGGMKPLPGGERRVVASGDVIRMFQGEYASTIPDMR